MILELVCGAGVGLGVLVVVWGLHPPRPPLAAVLTHQHHHAAAAGSDPPRPAWVRWPAGSVGCSGA